MSWRNVATTGGLSAGGSVGVGLGISSGSILVSVSSGITINGSGQIAVKNGSGIAFDGSGNLTVNAGVGLTLSGGFLTVGTGAGLSTSGGTVFIPGGAITNALLAALSVATANIQAGAVTATQIANATIGTAQIANAAITTALIANAAITNALLGTAVVGTANIQNAAITTALIANAAIGTAQVSSLDASVITTGSLSVTVQVSSIIGGGSVSTPTKIDGNGITVGNTSLGSAWTEVLNGSVAVKGLGVVLALGGLGAAGLTGFGLAIGSLFVANTLTPLVTISNLELTGIPRFDNVSTAAVSTPTWAGASCPSGAGGIPQTWIEVNANGFLGWVPVF